MMRRMTSVLLASIFCALPAVAAECDLLPAAELRQLVKAEGSLEQNSELPGSCRFVWAKSDQAARAQRNDEIRRQRMQRGSEDLQLLPLWNEVTIELLATAESLSQAQSLFANYARGSAPARYGSPDPLAGVSMEKLSETPERALAWNPARRQLLVRLGQRLLLLGVTLEDDAAKNKEQALKLGNGLK